MKFFKNNLIKKTSNSILLIVEQLTPEISLKVDIKLLIGLLIS